MARNLLAEMRMAQGLQNSQPKIQSNYDPEYDAMRKQQMGQSEQQPTFASEKKERAPVNMVQAIQQAKEQASGVEKAVPGELWSAGKAAALGAGESIGNAGISLANLVPHLLGSEKRIPHLDLEQYSDPEQFMPFLAGQILAPGIGGSRALQALNRFRRPAGWAGIGSDVARGAATGYALGEDAEGGGRGVGALVGGLTSPATGATNNELMRKFDQRESQSAQRFRQGFDRVFREAAQAGATHVPAIRIPATINRELPFSHASSERFRQAPTLENAFRFQSDLGKDMRALNRRGLHTLPSERIRAYHDAERLQERLNTSIEQSILRAGRPDVVENLNQLRAEYPSQRVPWLEPDIQEALGRHRTGRGNAGRGVKTISGTDSFKDELSQYFPELMLKNMLGRYGKAALYTGGAAAGLGYAGKKGIQHLIEASEK